MAGYYGTRGMNVGGMDLLNFLDIRDKGYVLDGDPTSMYDDLKEPKNGLESRDGDSDDLPELARKESRIPVAIRRLRPRDKSSTQVDGPSNNSLTTKNDKVDDWQPAWTSPLAGEKDLDKKFTRLHRRKLAPPGSSIIGLPPSGNQSRHQMTCPKCGRSCVMINRDGVYVAFSVGVTPLVLLFLFFIFVLFGWLSSVYGVGPSMFRRGVSHAATPRVEKQSKPRGGWIGRLVGKNQ